MIDRLTVEDRIMLDMSRRWPQDIGALLILEGRPLLDEHGRLRMDESRSGRRPAQQGAEIEQERQRGGASGDERDLPRHSGVRGQTWLLLTAILDWAVKLGVGEPAGLLPVVIWAATLGGLVASSLRRMERMEL